ncbi:hypothetical protein BVC80_9061g84 [Macleaya cordata]|uniref:Uncharacterized protein n=1 Tax=Macleaya cordata TaxID=56857 RepID=A0A200PN68_MACCD|nr:hypothetical protein BVC80_9061g84 [Macleaya cordata]
MESESCLKKMKNDSDSSREASFLDKVKVLEVKDIELLKVADGRVSLGPITPNPDRENGEAVLDCISPLTWVSSTPVVVCSDSGRIDESADIDSTPQTPKEDVFDPFAPGPDDLMLAPRVKKYLEESRRSVSRRLNFDSPEDFNDSSEGDDAMDEVFLHEEILLESMYESFLDAIVSKQTEEVAAEVLPDGLKTPTSLPLLNGIAETCPGAPMKPPVGSRNIDLGICRKLEF